MVPTTVPTTTKKEQKKEDKPGKSTLEDRQRH